MSGHTLKVPGASLYYTTRGAGPLLLVIQGGAGGAEGADGIGALLKDRFTVVGYDRRGFARSPLDGDPGDQPFKLETHADDAAALITALGGGPADVLGVSIGALIGIDLVSRSPALVRRLIAYEPPAEDLLSDAERQASQAMRDRLAEVKTSQGPAAAMRAFAGMLGVADEEREPQVVVPPPSPEQAHNVRVFFSRDAEAVRRYRVDLERLSSVRQKVLPAVGRASLAKLAPGDVAAALKVRPARCLAERLGTELVQFPGGHGAYVSMPRAFAERLRELL